MKLKIILFTFLSLNYFGGFSTVYTVVSSGNTFSPSTLTINSGDNVVFSIASSHNVVEVSQATYNSNGNTALSGGFSLPYGGGTLLPSALPVGTHYYVCTPHASMGMKAIIIVQACSAPAQPAAITGSAAICSGTSNTYSVAAVSGATSYTWTLPSGWSGTSTSTSITATASTSAGNISVTANNSCGSSAVKTLAVTVNNSPAQPTAITGNAAVCSGSSNTYSVAAVSGATSYTWTLPAGWSGSSASATITASANNAGGIISVKANNSCGSSATQTLTITTNTVDTSVSLSGSTLTANATGAAYQWINCNGNLPISGQTGQSFTAAATGSYAVIVSKNGCTDTSSCHAVIITAVNETAANTGFSLYPNPNKGRFVIECNHTVNSSIEIYNLIGELSFKTDITAARTEIDFSKHARGIYFVKYHNGNTMYTKRIVVE